MKNLFLLSFILLSFSCFSQTGVHAGITGSWFARPGVDDGLNLMSVGLNAGVFKRFDFYASPFYIQPELNLNYFGGKNEMENKVNFSTYGTAFVLQGGVDLGKWSIEAGGFANRLFWAKNNEMDFDNFGWETHKWRDYYHEYSFGGTGALSYNFIGMIGKISYLHGLTNVRTADKDGNPRYNYGRGFGNMNRSIIVSMYFPFKVYEVRARKIRA